MDTATQYPMHGDTVTVQQYTRTGGSGRPVADVYVATLTGTLNIHNDVETYAVVDTDGTTVAQITRTYAVAQRQADADGVPGRYLRVLGWAGTRPTRRTVWMISAGPAPTCVDCGEPAISFYQGAGVAEGQPGPKCPRHTSPPRNTIGAPIGAPVLPIMDEFTDAHWSLLVDIEQYPHDFDLSTTDHPAAELLAALGSLVEDHVTAKGDAIRITDAGRETLRRRRYAARKVLDTRPAGYDGGDVEELIRGDSWMSDEETELFNRALGKQAATR